MVKYFVHIVCSSVAVELYIIYIYIPRTEMFLVFNGKGSLLEGSNPKLEDKKVPGITVYVSYLCSQYLLAGRHLFLSSPDFMILFNDFATFLKGAKHTCALFTRNSQRKKPIRKQRSAPFVKRDRL